MVKGGNGLNLPLLFGIGKPLHITKWLYQAKK
jgi:hypothetical protein